MGYLVFDEETETHHSHKRKSNPFDKRNWIVMRGWKREGDSRAFMQYYPKWQHEGNWLEIKPEDTILVGHNIKFDLLYEMCQENPYLHDFYKRGGKIWCTQYAKYLLSGQLKKYHMCAMDDIVEEYGGRKKINGLKALWDSGVLTSEIQEDILEDYLIGTEEEQRNSGDIGNTELIYLGQLEQAKKLGMLHAIERRMDSLLCTTEMEFRGIKVDRERAKKDMIAFITEQRRLDEELKQYVADIPPEVQFSWTSGHHMSCLIFGGAIKYKMRKPYKDEDGEWARPWLVEKWPLFRKKPVDPRDPRLKKDDNNLYYVGTHPKILRQDTFSSGTREGTGRFKNVRVKGDLKVKWQDYAYTLPGVTKPDPDWKTALLDANGGPIYKTASEVIEEISIRGIPFLKDYAAKQKLEKILGTYYASVGKDGKVKGMLSCVMPETDIVHHSLNHSSTVTSRLSSNNPNFQNIPRKPVPVKGMFHSRFGEDGVMGEIDYSQLEVVVQGLLSRDKNLVRDLNARIDFHCKRVANKQTAKGQAMTYEEAVDWCKNESHPDYDAGKIARTGCKEFSFQLAYGAGAAAIAYSTGMPLEDVKLLMELELKEYPGVGLFNERVQRDVETSAANFRDPEKGFNVYRRGYWQSPTGTRYSFRSWDAPAFLVKRGILDSFSPPELKNYPVQGTGGELVQLVLGILWRHFIKKDFYNGKALLVNTVHDCIWFDMHKSVVDEVVKDAVRIMTSIPQYLKFFYKVDCPVPFPVEAEVGPNMLDLKHWHEGMYNA